MSPIFIAVLTILVALSDCFPSKESDMKANMKAVEKECAELNSVSLDDVMMGKNAATAPVTENIMCFDKCVFDKSGMLASDGQIKVDMILDRFSAGQTDKTDLIKSTVTKCNLLGDGQNTCAAVSAIIRCTFSALKPK